jgi:hypothetical protein
MKSKQEILTEKANLANNALRVAKTTLSDLESCAGEASIRDLLALFQASLKAHRELTSDIIQIEKEDVEALEKAKESSSEKELAAQYSGKVDELLKNFKK